MTADWNEGYTRWMNGDLLGRNQTLQYRAFSVNADIHGAHTARRVISASKEVEDLLHVVPLGGPVPDRDADAVASAKPCMGHEHPAAGVHPFEKLH